MNEDFKQFLDKNALTKSFCTIRSFMPHIRDLIVYTSKICDRFKYYLQYRIYPMNVDILSNRDALTVPCN